MSRRFNTPHPTAGYAVSGSQLVHEDLEQINDDDLEEMDLKWNMALLSMRARKFYQRTGRKIIIDGNSTAGYDKSKVGNVKRRLMFRFLKGAAASKTQEKVTAAVESRERLLLLGSWVNAAC
ncbi:hypothetical protein Tco_0490535 [Tanacetum coccineum]